jgi:hypothetical protein
LTIMTLNLKYGAGAAPEGRRPGLAALIGQQAVGILALQRQDRTRAWQRITVPVSEDPQGPTDQVR